VQFLDTSTDFLFGETVNSLDNPERAWPHKDMVKVMEGLRMRLQLSSFLFLHRDKEWLAACKRIHAFLDGYIHKAYAQLEAMQKGKEALHPDGRARDDFLWTIAAQVPDPIELRTQLTGVWIPSNETTSILMSNTLWALARHPDVVRKLRKEIVQYGDQSLTFEGLRSLTYMRWVINESMFIGPFHF
jgi:cytochrome P450 monooxygenase